MLLLSRSTFARPTPTPKLVRVLGVLTAVGWAFLSLDHRAAWPRQGLVAVGASAVAVAALRPLALAVPKVLMAPPRRVFVGACAALAAGLSWWVVHRALRDMPLIIDSGIYLFQARAMAHLHFGMRIPTPMQAFGDRFLLEGPDGRLYGVFPPGWPLAMVPFVWLKAPMLVGPSLAVLLVLAQASLGRAVGRAAQDDAGADLATRASLLLALFSFPRAIETADTLSHAFVALLGTVAVANAFETRREGSASSSAGRGLIIGACLGWAVASRLLDGLVLTLAVAGLLVWVPAGRAALIRAAVGAAPFVLLLLVEQRCATGAWLLPTQTAYFERSDWPPTCHRLGFGVDVGCTVEHRDAVASFGANGYDLREALKVVRARAGMMGEDLLGFPPLALLAFVPLVFRMSGPDAPGAVFVLALALTYGLFYFGNTPFVGARHLFPVAPMLWVAVARGALSIPHRARGWLDAAHARAAGLVVLFASAAVCGYGLWVKRGGRVAAITPYHSDLRRSLAVRGIDRGILQSDDPIAVASAVDSWADDDQRFFVLEDNAGLVELRRAHPTLPFMLSIPGSEIGTFYARPPPPGVRVELESAWPSFQRPYGLQASRVENEAASGKAALLLSHAKPGAEVVLPFEVARPGNYDLWVDGFSGPDRGNYSPAVDGAPLPEWDGFSPEPASLHGAPVRITLSPGRHTLTLRCLGRDGRSAGYDALLDVLVGLPARP